MCCVVGEWSRVKIVGLDIGDIDQVCAFVKWVRDGGVSSVNGVVNNATSAGVFSMDEIATLRNAEVRVAALRDEELLQICIETPWTVKHNADRSGPSIITTNPTEETHEMQISEDDSDADENAPQGQLSLSTLQSQKSEADQTAIVPSIITKNQIVPAYLIAQSINLLSTTGDNTKPTLMITIIPPSNSETITDQSSHLFDTARSSMIQLHRSQPNTTRVCCVAVDIGWVNTSKPIAMKNGEEYDASAKLWASGKVVPPLSEEDGVARVLDPLWRVMDGQVLGSGTIFRHFQVLE